MYYILALLLAVSTGIAGAQTPYPLQEIAEIGLIGTEFDQRPSASLGSATAFPDGAEVLRVEGFDDNHRPWRLFLPRTGVPISRMHVYRADLDGNGRADLVFSDVVIGNGRCVGDGTVTTLMFDEAGVPVPWRMDNQALIDDGGIPVLVADLNLDGRAEVVTSECTYAQRESVGLAEDRWVTGVYEAQETRWIPLKSDSLDPWLEAIKERFPAAEPGYLKWVPSPVLLSPHHLEGWGERSLTRLTGLLTNEIGCDYGSGPPPAGVAPDGGCTHMQMSHRTRYADGSVWAGWPQLIFESPLVREIHLIDFNSLRQKLEMVMGAGLQVRVIGSGQTASFLLAEEGLGSPKRDIAAGLEARIADSIPIAHWDRDVDEIREEQDRHFDTSSFIEPRPIDPSTVPPRRTDESQPLGGRYFSRDGRCFFMPFVESGVKSVRELDDCSKLPSLPLEAKSGERVLLNSRDQWRRVVSPKKRSVRSLSGFRSTVDHVIKEVEFQEIPGYSGEITGAVELGDKWLAQWRANGRNWFSLHDEKGNPLTNAIELDLEGELFDADLYTGAEFLRWSDGAPVQWLKVNIAFEWTVKD